MAAGAATLRRLQRLYLAAAVAVAHRAPTACIRRLILDRLNLIRLRLPELLERLALALAVLLADRAGHLHLGAMFSRPYRRAMAAAAEVAGLRQQQVLAAVVLAWQALAAMLH